MVCNILSQDNKCFAIYISLYKKYNLLYISFYNDNILGYHDYHFV